MNNEIKMYPIFATLKQIFKYIWAKDRTDLRIRFLFAALSIFIYKALLVLMPIIYKLIVDALSDKPMETAIATLVLLILAYGSVNFFSTVFEELQTIIFAPVGQNAVRKMSLDGFNHLHKLSMRFHIERRTGAISRAIERAARGLERIFNFAFWMALPAPVEILISLTMVTIILDIRYAFIILIAIFIYAYITLVVTKWRTKYRMEMIAADGDAHTKAVDSLLNFETVRSFNNENWEADRFDKGLKNYEKASVKSEITLALLNIAQIAVITVATVLVMLLITMDIVSGKESVGSLVFIMSVMTQLWRPLYFLGTTIREIRDGISDVGNLFQLMEQVPEIQDAADASELKITNANISFRNISFSYDERRQILNNVSFDIPAGNMVAIVGPSGSGKSTLSKLLFRYYEPMNGEITIDDRNINSVTQSSLRQNIGIVPQDTVLFNDTIGYNIAYGKTDASENEIIDAAKMSAIYEFIKSQPDGFEASVGERGLKLSGGEKQRVGIARAILKSPKIMVFDEATSALDTKTEQEIQESLDKVAKGRTTLIIAHRLSTVINADNIIVLEKGKIIEQGTHQELLAKQGVYAEMWQRQQQVKEAEAIISEFEDE